MLAHTGLPTSGLLDGLLHPVLGWDHLLAILAVGMLAAVVGDKRIALATPIGFVVGMLLGGLVGIAGLALGAVELAILGSVVVLGLLLAIPNAKFGWWLPILAAGLGAFHGHAHGNELPAAAMPALYVAGFIAATVALHAAGAGTGLLIGRSERVRAGVGGTIAGLGVLLAFVA